MDISTHSTGRHINHRMYFLVWQTRAKTNDVGPAVQETYFISRKSCHTPRWGAIFTSYHLFLDVPKTHCLDWIHSRTHTSVCSYTSKANKSANERCGPEPGHGCCQQVVGGLVENGQSKWAVKIVSNRIVEPQSSQQLGLLQVHAMPICAAFSSFRHSRARSTSAKPRRAEANLAEIVQ